jgi:hypothetical protein
MSKVSNLVKSDLAGEYLLNDFQIEVAKAIRNYRELTTSPTARRKVSGKGSSPRTKRTKYPSAQRMERQVEELVAQPDFKKYFCPFLKAISNDAFEIAKVITPILIALMAAGKIQINLDPLIFAAISIFIARAGTASVCEDYVTKETKTPQPRKTARSTRKSKG